MSFTPAEQLLYTTTRITGFGPKGHYSLGTGFFYQVVVQPEPLLVSTVLITNRHVIAGCDEIELTLPLRNGDQLPSDKLCRWRHPFAEYRIDHPEPDVDLVAINVTGWHHREANGELTYPFYIPLSAEAIPQPEAWSSFDAIEEVTMVGCPNGLFDETNNLPIVRRGITATHPGRNYQGKEELMVDLACFPGSSGSPIFLYSTGTRYDRASGGFSIGSIQLYLLGVLYSGPVINQRGQVVLTQPATVHTAAMMHLGNAIKSTKLLAFDDLIRRQFNTQASNA